MNSGEFTYKFEPKHSIEMINIVPITRYVTLVSYAMSVFMILSAFFSRHRPDSTVPVIIMLFCSLFIPLVVWHGKRKQALLDPRINKVITVRWDSIGFTIISNRLKDKDDKDTVAWNRIVNVRNGINIIMLEDKKDGLKMLYSGYAMPNIPEARHMINSYISNNAANPSYS